MQIELHDIGIWLISAIIGILIFLVKRTLHAYDKSLQELTLKITEHTDSFRSAILEFQKEISQIRLEAALLKQSSTNISKYTDKIQEIEKNQIIMESQIKAAFAILSRKRGIREDE